MSNGRALVIINATRTAHKIRGLIASNVQSVKIRSLNTQWNVPELY